MSGFWLSRLGITAFRNHSGLSLETTPDSVVLIGPNGAGKTNILEAISLLSPGRGLRRAPYGDMAQAGANLPWSVATTLETPEGPVKIGTGPKPDAPADSRSRIVRIDGETAPAINALADHVRVLWLTPAMDGLFAGSASDRRAFLDRLVLAIDPAHGTRVNAFERTMRDRNRVNADPNPDSRWLDALEEQMAEIGTAIAAGRNTAVTRLRDVINRDAAERPDDPFPWSVLTLQGPLENQLETANAVAVEDEYRAMLRDARISDREAGRTLAGPHRSDLIVSHGPKAIEARLASTGEQKALLIGLILAHARLVANALGGTAPILLLDEVAAHLDEHRRAALFQRLLELGGQAWMTGTDSHAFEFLADKAQILQLDDGAIKFADA